MGNISQSDDKHAALKNRIRAWSLVVVVIFLIPVVYGFVYFQDRNNYTTSLYFRSLAEIENQLNQGLKSLDYLLDFALNEHNPKTKKFCKNQQTKKYCDQYKDHFAKHSKSFKHIQFFECNTNKKSNPNAPCANNQGDDQPRNPASDKTLFKLIGVLENRKINVYQAGHELAAQIPLKDLIDPAPSLKYFNQILLLDKQGNILYRSGSDELKTRNFDARDDFARFENLFHYLQTDEITEMDLSSKKFATQRIDVTTSHSTVRNATIGSISYMLFIQPVHPAREQIVNSKEIATVKTNSNRISHPATGALHTDQLAYLVGVVSKKKQLLDTLSLPLGQITILLIALLLIILLIPHFKLELSGPHFMPSKTLAVSLAISLPLLVILWVTGYLGGLDYFRMKDSLDQTARTLAEAIQQNFRLEFGRLRDTDPCPKIYRSGQSPNSKTESVIDHNVNAIMVENSTSRYPDFEISYALGNDGLQSGKQFVYRAFPSVQVDVRNRDYFKQPYYYPENLMAWPASSSDGQPQAFFSERIQTYDQNTKLTAYSRPGSASQSVCRGTNSEQTPAVHTLIKLMHTFFQPVLPVGFGFAVVKDSTGGVLYHSDDQRSLLENFFIETDQNANLIAAVQRRHERSINGSYKGINHGFWVTPIANMPWTLVVFYDKSLIEVAHLKACIFSLILAAIFVVLLPLIALYFLYPALSDRLERFAPHGQFWVALRKRYKHKKWVIDYFKTWYVLSAVLAFVIPFGFATWLIYNTVFAEQMERLSKLNLAHVGHQLLIRKKELAHEVNRLVRLENNSQIKQIKYLDPKLNCSLYQFAVYASGTSACSNPSVETCAGPSINQCPDNTRNQSAQIKDNRKNMPVGLWMVTIDADDQCPTQLDSDEPELGFDRVLPLLSRLDADHRLMMYSHASDRSWSFSSKNEDRTLSAHILDHRNQKCLLLQGPKDPSINPHPAISGDHNPSWLRVFLGLFYLIVGLLLIYHLVKMIARRLLGLAFPPRGNWRNYFMRYQPEPILAMAPPAPEPDDPNGSLILDDRNDVAETNLKKIVSGRSDSLLELKSILFNRAKNRLINTDNTEPLMWLILGGLFQYSSHGIDFDNPKMKKWVREQNWSKQIDEYESTSRTDLWRLLAPAFYVAVLLGIGYLILSGGHIGELMVTLLPVLLAGGLPIISQIFEKFVRD